MVAGTRFPLGGIGVALLGATLVSTNGFFTGESGYGLSPFLVIANAATAGWITFAGGIVAVLLAVPLTTNPRSHTLVGVIWITIATLALDTGGGFLLGSLLLYAAGLFALYHNAEIETVSITGGSPANEDAAPAPPEKGNRLGNRSQDSTKLSEN